MPRARGPAFSVLWPLRRSAGEIVDADPGERRGDRNVDVEARRPLKVSPVRLDQMISGLNLRSRALVGTDCLTNVSASSSGTTSGRPGWRRLRRRAARGAPRDRWRGPRSRGESRAVELEPRRALAAEQVAGRRALVGQLDAGVERGLPAGQLDRVREHGDTEQLAGADCRLPLQRQAAEWDAALGAAPRTIGPRITPVGRSSPARAAISSWRPIS